MPPPTLEQRRPAWRGGPWSDPSAARLFRVAVVAIMLLAAAMPWVARAAIAMLAAESTIPFDWVPAAFPARRDYARFTAEFGSGDVVVASWPGCTLDDPVADRFAVAATGPEAPCDAAGRRWFDVVATGREAVERLVAPPLALDRAEAVDRLRGVVVGPDGRRTCVIVGFTREGLADRRQAVAWIRDTLRRMSGVAAADLHLAGTVIDNVAVDAASGESLRVYGGPAAAIIFVLTWLALRSLRYAIVVFLLALVCVGIAFASLAICGDRMNPVLIVMPLLVLTLGVSGGIHLVNYLVEEYRRGPSRGAAWRAVRVGWLPCSLSAGTTAVGLGSLVVSELEPIRTFGFHAAVGVLGTLVVLFLVLPGIFARWPIRRRLGAAAGPAPADPWARATTGHAATITAVAVVALAAAGLGVPGIRTSVGIDTLFTPDSRLIGDYAWLEQEIGPLVPVEVVVRFAADSGLRAAERLDVVSEIGQALRGLPPVAGVTSAAVFVPDGDEATGARAAARKAVLARKLEASLAQLTDMRLVRVDDEGQLWRVTARTSALAGLDYGDLLADVRGVVEPVVARHGGSSRGIVAAYTGAMPLINAIQNTLLRDLFTSFLSALGVITLVMMAVEGGVMAGLVAMIPNVFPMVLLFGILGWTRVALDIGSVMTASVALGMAVDGTFHFLTFFRQALRGSAADDAGGRVAAVHAAYRHSAGALAQSALVCGIGILAFAASPFAPTRRFAWMLSLLVFAALVGDLVVLPALLATRAGRWFRAVRGDEAPGQPPEGSL
jgi:predicted RND superfamily exporter protein